jgi:hypothetical protein
LPDEAQLEVCALPENLGDFFLHLRIPRFEFRVSGFEFKKRFILPSLARNLQPDT